MKIIRLKQFCYLRVPEGPSNKTGVNLMNFVLIFMENCL